MSIREIWAQIEKRLGPQAGKAGSHTVMVGSEPGEILGETILARRMATAEEKDHPIALAAIWTKRLSKKK